MRVWRSTGTSSPHTFWNPWTREWRKRTREKGHGIAEEWFSHAGSRYQSGWERVPDYYLVKDDVPNFLRVWLNRCAVDMDLKNWTFNGHRTAVENDKSHGNAAFLSGFRQMLVMEIGDSLWLGRVTPRAWLDQGKHISVKNAPTHFGDVAYEIVSDVEDGRISATVEMPSRRAPEAVLMRFRHPKSLPMHRVTVNGTSWTEYDTEAVVLRGLTGTVSVAGEGRPRTNLSDVFAWGLPLSGIRIRAGDASSGYARDCCASRPRRHAQT